MNIEQARNLSLESFIKQLGYQEVTKGNSREAWFKSPLRDEKTASFKVDRRTNKYIDFGGESRQKDIIDFVKEYGERKGWGSLNTSEALKRIASIAGEAPRLARPRQERDLTYKEKASGSSTADSFRIDHIGPLHAKKLIDYLRERKLPVTAAKDYVQQIHYTHMPTNRQYYGLTWKNEAGGQEVRNPFFKTVIGNKGMSVIDVKHPKTVPGTAIFEGMTDYLSYLKLARQEVMARAIVMNGTGMYERVVKLVGEGGGNEPVKGYLQNDKGGLEAAAKLKAGIPRLQLQNSIYSAYTDVNDYLTGKPMKMEDKRLAEKVLAGELKNEEGPVLKVTRSRSVT